MKLRAVVVDDEAIARRHLVRLLARHDSLEVVGQAANGIEALSVIRELQPDLLFLDVEMPGMDGFQLLRELPKQPIVVFTTAHDRYALAAFKENSVEYLLKPVGSEDVDRAVRKVSALAAAAGPDQQVIEKVLLQLKAQTQKQILLPVRDVLRPVRLDQIVYLEARDKSTIIYTLEGTFQTETSLADLESRLPADDFIRIHRQHIVNVKFIRELQRWGNRQLKVVFTTPVNADLYVSRRSVDEVVKRLGHVA
jgi:two-component system, LytTR family, response regulator